MDIFLFEKKYEKNIPFSSTAEENYILLKSFWKQNVNTRVFFLISVQGPMFLFSWVFKTTFKFQDIYWKKQKCFFKRMRKMKWKILKMKSHSCPLIKFHKVLIVWDFMTVTFIIYLTSVQQVIRHFTGMFHSCNDSPANDDY